ncbi:MAG: QacE family quaternary ammonium compound efflux SMR transporter [Treponema sp.]|nr:QacE family quaternary ammonium compound efflux SMR transporter [Treponema sp.]
MKYLFLSIAIVSEIIATTALKYSNEFKNFVPVIFVVIGYANAFYFLSKTLTYIPIGIAYAIWSGIGIVLISTIGFVFFKQRLDVPAIIGICLILIGVVIINIFSKSVSH